MTQTPVALSVADGVAELTLRNGPLNLVTAEMLRALDRHLAALAATPDLRCAILSGGDARAFCAGSDMHAFAALRDDAGERKILFEDAVLRRLAALGVPTIAAIDAPALGGGFELALACDLRVLRDGVPVALPEARIGGLAGNGAVRLARLVGPARAKEMLFTGRAVSGPEALAWGLVNRLAAERSALEEARALAAEIAARGPLSNRLGKALVAAALDGPADAALSQANEAQAAIFRSADLAEGTAAFFAKRPPVFSGR